MINNQIKSKNSKSSLDIEFKLFDTSLPLPQYQTKGSVGIDLYSRVDLEILAGSIGYAPLNIGLKIPEGYYAQLSARSSLHKRGLWLANGIGIGDYDFCGENDEYQAALFNFSPQKVNISRGERLVQLMILSVPRVNLRKIDKLNPVSRGGFGSTGNE